MQDYSPPAYPTRTEKPEAALGKLPKRWAKNAAIIACISALSLGTLAGCTTERVSPAASCDDGTHGVVAAYPQDIEHRREFDVVIRTHYGGSGAGPMYVAYLTEQEAMGIIRNRLCEAGICFDAPLPNYVAATETPWAEDITVRLSFFDERTGQGIVFSAPWWDEFRWGRPGEEIESDLQQDFKERFNISATFMRNPGESMCDGDWWEREVAPTFTEEEKQDAGLMLERTLLARVDAFIAQLRTEGILSAEGAGS